MRQQETYSPAGRTTIWLTVFIALLLVRTASGLTINLTFDPDANFTAAGLTATDITNMKAACFYAATQFTRCSRPPCPVFTSQSKSTYVQFAERIGTLIVSALAQCAPPFWSGDNRDAKFDLHDLKGLLEEFLEQFGLRAVTWTRRAEAAPLFLESARVQIGGKLTLGEAGQLSPLVAKLYDLRDPVLFAELDLDALLLRRNPGKSFKPLPQFPGIRRDVAMLVPGSTNHEAVLSVVRQTRPANLEAVELFDVFRGQHVPAGQKSVAYAFTYRHAERTLTDAEVNAAHETLVEQFRQKLQATIR